ncbi:LemA family protein [Flexivirga endophytica]|uniref:LemA family protein n=1 Tax=Flexivirga endophytica TaxID=1849103 RepID=A0A916WWE2_9MICO|nr:LemA family protein [Flexivirga endophytica]GGB35777.1 LemA family protein [Flexivirga endophytica]GHB43524.1 LemA family protein [Flexivirga endophytica]
MAGLVVLIVLVAALVMWWRLNVSIVRLHSRVDEAWSDVLAQLQRRADLVPSLVELVRGYVTHEETVLRQMVEAWSGLLHAQDPGRAADAEAELSRAVHATYAVSERYPQLRASSNFLHLQRELVHTEDKVVASRRFYNGAVREFNSHIATWPGSSVAHRHGWQTAEFFTATTAAADPPVVDLGR